MKVYFSFFLVFILFSCINKSRRINNIGNIEKEHVADSVFNSPLRCKISNMIDVKKRRKNHFVNFEEICSVIISESSQETNKCLVIITLMSKIDSLKISGYTFFDNELVVCYLSSDKCVNKLMNKNNLIQYRDSIAGYSGILNNKRDMVYDAPICTYQIAENDSLILLKSYLMN